MKTVLAVVVVCFAAGCASLAEDAGKIIAKQVNAFCLLSDEAKQAVQKSATAELQHEISVDCKNI